MQGLEKILKYSLILQFNWKHISRYEFTLATVFAWVPLFVSKTILQTFYHANIDYLRNWQSFMLAFGIGSMIYSTFNVGCNYLWTNTYGFFPPIPFGGFTIPFMSIPAIYATMWFMIPKSARTEKELKRRFVIFLVSRVYDILASWVYAFISLLFVVIPSNYQPILGIFCPLFSEVLLKILIFITHRAGGGRHVKMGKCYLNTASGKGSNITIVFEMKLFNIS